MLAMGFGRDCTYILWYPVPAAPEAVIYHGSRTPREYRNSERILFFGKYVVRYRMERWFYSVTVKMLVVI